MDFVSELSLYFKAGYPFMYVQALEVERAVSSIKKACDDFNDKGLPCQVWRNNKGWEGASPQGQWGVIDPTKSLDKIVNHINEGPSGVYLLINFHFYLGKEARADLIQQFMDGYYDWKGTGKKVIIVSPFFEIAKELERLVQMVRYSLPTKKE